MRWEDERYVRLYTRDTVDWHFLSLEAQGLMGLILRKVDRAGILHLGRHGKKGVAAAIGHPTRVDSVLPALDELLSDGCVRIVDGETLVVPNFIEAQETPSSDAQRKRDQRERDRDKLISNGQKINQSGQDITAAMSRAVTYEVTNGHAESRAVTPNRAVPPVPPVPFKPPNPLSGELTAESLELVPQEPKPPDPSDSVMAHYLEALKASGKSPRVTPKGRKYIRDRLEGTKSDPRRWSVQECIQAIDGLTWSEFHMSKGFVGIKYALRSSEQMELMLESLRAGIKSKETRLRL
jgi:hypothetical protein